MNCMKKKIILTSFQVFFIVVITIFFVLPFSCKVTNEGVQFVSNEYSAPILEKLNVIDENTICLEFSQSINSITAIITPKINDISDSDFHSFNKKLSPSISAANGEFGFINSSIRYSENKKSVTFILQEKTTVGTQYQIYGNVEDNYKNTLTFSFPFTAYNSRIPKIIMTEIQPKYAKGTSKGNTIYRTEFIELFCAENGNLGGLILISASDGIEKSYKFPAIEVTKNQIILVHLRTAGDGCFSENGTDLNIATATFSHNKILDLWSENTQSRLNDKSDIIYIKNTLNNKILDCFIYKDENLEIWDEKFSEFINEICEYPEFYIKLENPMNSKGITPLKSFTKKSINSNEWEIKKVTPGWIE